MMQTMKLSLLLLLCMLAVGDWIPCEASRKGLIKGAFGEGSEGLLPFSRKILVQELDDMETELILPDDLDGEKVGEEKGTKQEKFVEHKSPMKDMEEQKLEKKKKKKQQKEAVLEEKGQVGLLLEGVDEEKPSGKKLPEKARGGETGEAAPFAKQKTSSQITGENLQEGKGSMKTKKKKKNATSGQDTSFNTETKGEEVEGFPGEVSLADMPETVIEASGGNNKENGANSVEEEFHVKKSSDIEIMMEESQHNGEDDAKEKPSKGKKSQKQKEEAKAAKTAKTTKKEVQEDMEELSSSEVLEEETPADVIEREMKGKDEALLSEVLEEENGGTMVKEKQREAGTDSKPGLLNQEEHLDQFEKTQGKDGKESLKKKKALEKPKKEVKEEGDMELEDNKEDTTMKAKPLSTEEASLELVDDLQEEKLQEVAKPKVKSKKKKGKMTEKTKNEEKLLEKAKKKEQVNALETQNSDEGIKDVMTEDDQTKDKKPSKGSSAEILDIQKQEKKRKVEAEGATKEVGEGGESSAQGMDDEDDEYGDFMQDFADIPFKFQETAYKVADHLGPNLQRFTDTSKGYFNKANQQIMESFSPLVGKQFAPFLASLVSYGLLLVPLAIVILLFEHIRALLSLQKVLLFVNIYLAAYFVTLLLATFIMGEPMTFFYRSSTSGYIHLQLLQAFGYIIYLILQTCDLVLSCTAETLPVKVTVVLQWFVAFTIGFHYYVTIFHRAMAGKGPHTNWKIYGIYSIAFFILCLFARIKRVKKGYTQLGQVDMDKKN